MAHTRSRARIGSGLKAGVAVEATDPVIATVTIRPWLTFWLRLSSWLGLVPNRAPCTTLDIIIKPALAGRIMRSSIDPNWLGRSSSLFEFILAQTEGSTVPKHLAM